MIFHFCTVLKPHVIFLIFFLNFLFQKSLFNKHRQAHVKFSDLFKNNNTKHCVCVFREAEILLSYNSLNIIISCHQKVIKITIILLLQSK